jgi:hypothetical protein
LLAWFIHNRKESKMNACVATASPSAGGIVGRFVGRLDNSARRLAQIETQLLQCRDLATLCGEFERELLWGGADMLHSFETVLAALFFAGDLDCVRAVDKLRQQLAEPDATATLWESVFCGVHAAAGAHLLALHHSMMLFFELSRRLIENDSSSSSSSSSSSVIDASVKSSFERWLRRALVLSAPVVCVERRHVGGGAAPARYGATFDWMIQFVDSKHDRAIFRALLVDRPTDRPTDEK